MSQKTQDQYNLNKGKSEEANSMVFESQDGNGGNSADDKSKSKGIWSPDRVYKRNHMPQYDGSPASLEKIKINLKQEVQLRKEKNEANQQLQKFKKCLQKQDMGNTITTSSEKISMIPMNLREDLQEAVLYAYFSVRYYDEHIFKVIQTRTNNFSGDRNLNQLLGKERSFQQLSIESSYSRFRLNQIAFEVSIDKDYFDVAFHFIETGQAQITWEIVRKMISKRQEYLVKQCIKYGSKFDPGSASLKKIIFAGRSAAPLEDRTIKLVDFIQVMLELRWKSKEIKEVLINFSKKAKIDSFEVRELFLMFAVKRKIKLMSFLINSDQFMMEVHEDNFIDVIENDAYDIGVLLYREYFLKIDSQHEKIINLLVNSFTKTNGLLEAKCFLLKKFYAKMNFEQAIKLLSAIEERINDSSKGNILILTLNVIKAVCLLIELAEKVRKQFNFLNRRVQEIRSKLVSIANKFMNDIQTEEEMRFYLLEKDLDERDSLNIIYDYQVIDLLQNPFTQNIVQQIWQSQYNNSHSPFAVSSLHRLLFNYNHCRYDEEEQLRFYKPRDLSKIGCHGFQFQVWRFSGQSRHLVASITTLIFVIVLHLLITAQMTESNYLVNSDPTIQYWKQKYYEKDDKLYSMSPEQFALREGMFNQWNMRIYNFQRSAQDICTLFHFFWMYIIQHIINVIFAVKNKRTPHLADPGNFIDFMMFMVSLLYIFSYYKGWRLNTFLEVLEPNQLGEVYWSNYMSSPINENIVLFCFGFLMWAKVFYQLKYIQISGSLFAIAEKMFIQMLTFAIFYFSLLFLYSVVGFVLFYDLEQFQSLNGAMFTLFKTTISDYDADIMQNARIGSFIGYCYFLSFMILNLILIVNLIVARLANTYKEYSKKKHLLMLLNTLYVREVSEADDKYSAVISAPFPMNLLNFPLSSLVISMKSQIVNLVVLNIYYLPISSLCFVTFFFYQFLILPFCYVKIIGHKFALMVKSPQGLGARSTLDRAGHGILFIIIGPLVLALNAIVDLYWFLRHLYKMDLDKSHLQRQETAEIHRRTYKKMIKYFEQKNEQLVPQKKVAEDLRTYLDVMEGVKCLVYGRPKEIPNDKLGLYIAYAKSFIKESQDKRNKYELDNNKMGSNTEIVEQIVAEFNVVKQVLLNNSIPVDLREIQQNSVKKKGWGMKILFDKKTFHALLLDLERMRKVLYLKKSFYIFHIPYEGKAKEMNNWHIKVEKRITQTLKFLNTARLLRIIGYDPVYHIKFDNINLAMGDQQLLKSKSINYENSQPFKYQPSINRSTTKIREDNLQSNFQFMINKYSNVSRQVKEMTDILKRLNMSNNQLSMMQSQINAAKYEPLPLQIHQSAAQQNVYHQQDHENKENTSKKSNSAVKQLEVSFHDDNGRESGVNYDSQRIVDQHKSQQQPQKQLNYVSPSKLGVIGQYPEISHRSNQSKANEFKKEKMKMKVHYSERSQSEAVVSSDEESEAKSKKFGDENFNGFQGRKR